ncbi:glycosyltransferase, partial [Arcobacter porcinus]
QHIVLEAVEKLRVNGLNIRALVIGHYMDKRYFDDLQLKYPNAIFTGFKPNPMDYMQISDCFVLATKKETFGLVLIEAMKSGICVLASKSGGPLEIIDDEKTGLLFEPMNSEDLAIKLKIIYEDNDFRKSIAKKGKEKSDIYFDSLKQFEELKNILEEI